MTLEVFMTTLVISIVPLGGALWDTEYVCGKVVKWEEVAGIYNWDGKIYVCRDRHTKFNIEHEIWHAIWFEFLTEKQRKEYTKQWKKDMKKWTSRFIFEYAMTNEEESFAEDYAYWKKKMQVNIHVKKRIKIVKSFLQKTK